MEKKNKYFAIIQGGKTFEIPEESYKFWLSLDGAEFRRCFANDRKTWLKGSDNSFMVRASDVIGFYKEYGEKEA